MLETLISCIKVALLLTISGWLIAGCYTARDRTWFRQRANLIAPALYVVAMFSFGVWTIFVVMTALIPMVARRPQDVAMLLPICLLSVPSIGYDFRLFGIAIGFIDTWRLATIGALVALAITRKTRIIRLDWSTFWPLATFCVLSAIISIRGANATTALRGLIDIVLFSVFPFVVFAISLARGASIAKVLLATVFAVSLQSVIAVYQSRAFWPIYENIYWSTGLPLPKALAFKMRAGMMRATGSLLESNALAVLIGMGIIILLSLRNRFSSTSTYLSTSALLLLAIYATLSRGGFVFAAIGWLTFEAYHGRWNRVGLAFVALGSLYGMVAVASRFVPRLSVFTASSPGTSDTLDYRSRLFQRGLEEIIRHPFFGQTPGQIQVSMADLRQGENIIDFVNGYVYVGVFGGIGAVLALFFLFVGSAWQLRSIRAALPTKELRNIAASCFAINCALIVTTFTSGFFGNAFILYVMVMAITSVLLSVAAAPAERVRRFVIAQDDPYAGSPLRG